MNSQAPSHHQSILFSSVPPLQELMGYSFRINSGLIEPPSCHSSTQQCSRNIARNVPNFLVAPSDQTSLSLDYTEAKQRLVILTSTRDSQSEAYRDKLREYNLKDQKGIEVNARLFEECHYFTLCSRLSPKWNRFGSMLVLGQDFLSGHRTQTVLALKLESKLQSGELCLSLTPYSITYRPLDLMGVLNMSQGQLMPDTPESLQLLCGKDLSRLGVCCQILPNLTRGYIHSVTRQPLSSSPLPDYTAVCQYWRSVHGYQLPLGESPYFVNVSFQWRSSRALTYPLPCVLTDNSIVSRYSPASSVQLVGTFLRDINFALPSHCGFQFCFSQKVYPHVPHHPLEAPARPDNATHVPSETQPVRTETERYKPCFKAKPITHKLQNISNLPTASHTKYVSCHSQPVHTPRPHVPSSLPPIRSPPLPLYPNYSQHSSNITCTISSYSTKTDTPCDTISSLPRAPTGTHRDPPQPSSPSAKPPAAKKPRVAKPTPAVDELLRAGQLEKASVASLSEWLRERKVTFKSKEKKAQLLVLVRQHSVLMSES